MKISFKNKFTVYLFNFGGQNVNGIQQAPLLLTKTHTPSALEFVEFHFTWIGWKWNKGQERRRRFSMRHTNREILCWHIKHVNVYTIYLYKYQCLRFGLHTATAGISTVCGALCALVYMWMLCRSKRIIHNLVNVIHGQFLETNLDVHLSTYWTNT